MKTFYEWIRDSATATKEKIEIAVREYMKGTPEAKRCYYVTRPKNMHFDPSNPKHLEDELGPNYDRSLDVVPFKHHPQSFTCVNVADGLAKFLREKGFKARKVAGWYGNAEPGYWTGHSASFDQSSPPRGMRNAQEHWWVEAEGYYIDITSAQFHPMSPQDQKELKIADKYGAFDDMSYIPASRFPLGRSVPLPDNAKRMVDKIVSMKSFRAGHSTDPGDNHKLGEWILKNAVKYGIATTRAMDIVHSLNSLAKPGFYFADTRAMERLFGEAWDDIEEDEGLKELDKNPEEFKPAAKPGSMGTVRMDYGGRISLTTTSSDIQSNFNKMKDIIDTDFSAEDKSSTNNYGTVVHKISSKMSSERISEETRKKLKDAGFKVEF